MYKLVKTMITQEVAFIQRDDGNGNFAVFGFDPENADYQAYLKWLEEGNTPLPADE